MSVQNSETLQASHGEATAYFLYSVNAEVSLVSLSEIERHRYKNLTFEMESAKVIKVRYD